VLPTLAYGLLGAALYVSRGHYHPVALVLVCVALAIVMVDLVAAWSGRVERLARHRSGWALGAVVAFGFFGLLTKMPGGYLPPGTALGWFRAGVVVAALLALGYARSRLPVPRFYFGALVALYLLLGVWIIRVDPAPAIDVWHFQQRAVELLLQGQNPYASFYPNIYGGTGLYGSGYLKDGRLYSFTYPPLVILWGLPGWLIGDVRYSLLAAVAGAACFTVAMGRRLGLPPGHRAELAAVALLFHPRAFFLIDLAWVDPFLVLSSASLLWGLAGRRPAERWVPLGLVFAAKQYGIFWLPSLLACRRLSRRETIRGLLLAAAIALPFFAWSPPDLWRGVVLIQVSNPFRADALSALTVIARWTGLELPSAIAFVAAAVVVGLAVRRAAPGREAIGGAAVFLAFFAFNKQAFLNYYWLVGTFLLLAVVSEMARWPSDSLLPPAEEQRPIRRPADR
jgi:hypothetical protein